MARQLGEQPLLGLLDLLLSLLGEPDQRLLPALEVAEALLALLYACHQGFTPHLQIGLGGEQSDGGVELALGGEWSDGGLDLVLELGLGGERSDDGLQLVLAFHSQLLPE